MSVNLSHIVIRKNINGDSRVAKKEHKLDEWREYCDWIKTLPYSEFITMEETK